MLKKEINWIQPPTIEGIGDRPSINFEEILLVSKSVSKAEINNWKDIDRIDVRPSKGVLKIKSKNNWEIQIDSQTGELLSSNLRRSDLIESLHDGSFFSDKIKMWVFFPSGILLFFLWITGILLFVNSLTRRLEVKKLLNKINLNKIFSGRSLDYTD